MLLPESRIRHGLSGSSRPLQFGFVVVVAVVAVAVVAVVVGGPAHRPHVTGHCEATIAATRGKAEAHSGSRDAQLGSSASPEHASSCVDVRVLEVILREVTVVTTVVVDRVVSVVLAHFPQRIKHSLDIIGPISGSEQIATLEGHSGLSAT